MIVGSVLVLVSSDTGSEELYLSLRHSVQTTATPA
jgi:hypothetical protein